MLERNIFFLILTLSLGNLGWAGLQIQEMLFASFKSDPQNQFQSKILSSNKNYFFTWMIK